MRHRQFTDFRQGVFQRGLQDLPIREALDHCLRFFQGSDGQASLLILADQGFQELNVIQILRSPGIQLALNQIERFREEFPSLRLRARPQIASKSAISISLGFRNTSSGQSSP